jgi:hypothetical protein
MASAKGFDDLDQAAVLGTGVDLQLRRLVAGTPEQRDAGMRPPDIAGEDRRAAQRGSSSSSVAIT